MWNAFLPLIAVALATAAGCAHVPSEPVQTIEPLRLDDTITVRRMVVRHGEPREVVLFLHGFPETLYAFKGIAEALGDGYEAHAFDWPGYGQSARPPVATFPYAPKDYARVLRDYVRVAGIDRSKLTIYATDIGGLPALLAALDEPDIAKRIIVGDFAPFDRPAYMYESLQALKAPPASVQVRAALNKGRDEILQNTWTRGLADDAKYALTPEFREDAARGWGQEGATAADAFAFYYAHFSRDQAYLEANMARLKTPVNVVWGEKDLYIHKAMGEEFARAAHAPIEILPGIGHYPHLQDPRQVVEEIRAATGR